MISQYAWILKAAGVALALWLAYDYGASSVREDWHAERAEINKATADAMSQMNAERASLQQKLTASEQSAWEEYRNAQIENDRLNTELVNRPWRVRVERPACDSVPAYAGTASLGNGASTEYAELPAETARGLAEIGRDAEQCEAKLKALQDYVKAIKNNPQ